MTQEESLENLLEEVKFRVRSQNDPVTFNLIKQTIADCVSEMQYVIIPKNVETASSRAQDLERIIDQNTLSINADGDLEIHGQIIMQQLASEGWIIIPPL